VRATPDRQPDDDVPMPKIPKQRRKRKEEEEEWRIEDFNPVVSEYRPRDPLQCHWCRGAPMRHAVWSAVAPPLPPLTRRRLQQRPGGSCSTCLAAWAVQSTACVACTPCSGTQVSRGV
jgi:hypothetical protein